MKTRLSVFIREHLPTLLALGLFLGSLGLYLSTLAPGIVPGDPGEYQTVPWVLGIAHPPGYTFYTVFGKLFATLVPLGRVAWRMNLLSAVCGALLVTLTHAIIYQVILSSSTPPLSPRHSPFAHSPFAHSPFAILPALIGALALAVSVNLWQHASHANAHIVTATLAATSLFLLLRWQATADDRWLYVFAFVAGLSPTHHPLLLFGFPAYALFVLLVRPRLLTRPGQLLRLVGCFLLGLSTWLYLPLRSRMGPPFGPDTLGSLQGFLYHVTAQGLRVNLFLFGPAEQLKRLGDVIQLLRLQYHPLLLLLGLPGAGWLLWRRPKAALLLLGYGALTTLATINILQDALAYLLGPFLVYAVLIGLGAQVASCKLQVAGCKLRNTQHATRTKYYVLRVVSYGLIFCCFLLVLLTGARNQPRLTLHDYRAGDEWVNAVFDRFAGRGEGARLLCEWEKMTPLYYVQLVEGRHLDPADVQAVFVAAAGETPWLTAVWQAMDQVGEDGPIYLSSYRPSVASLYRLWPEGPFYRVYAHPLPLVPPTAHPLDVDAEGVVRLLGYELDRTSLRVGETLHLTLYMQAPQKLDGYYLPFVLLAREHRFTTDGRYNTPQWEPGEVVMQRYDVTVPFGVEPGEYPLRVGISWLSGGRDLTLSTRESTHVAPDESRTRRADRSQTGQEQQIPTGETTVELARIRVEPPRLSPPERVLRQALGNFGQRIALTGATVQVDGRKVRAFWDEPIPVHPGGRLRVTLGWRALQRMDESYKVFVHLLGPYNPATGGPVWAQSDFFPLGGTFPTHLWIPKWIEGQSIADRYELTVPENAPPGEYELEVGWYEMNSVRRLPTFDAAGNQVGDRVVLGRVRVGP